MCVFVLSVVVCVVVCDSVSLEVNRRRPEERDAGELPC